MSARTLLTSAALVLAALMPGSAARGLDAPAPARTDVFGEGELHLDYEYARVGADRPLRLDLYRPAEAGPVPTVVFLHGGGWSRGDKSRARRRGLTRRLTERGYAVASVEYRLSGEAKFPAQIHDVKRAVRFLRRHAGALGLDSARMGSWGVSAGGHLATLLAVTDADDGLEPPADGGPAVSTRVLAAASWVGPMDLRVRSDVRVSRNARRLLERFIGRSPDEAPEAYAQASPVHFVTPDDPAVFLVQGLDDPLVPSWQAEVMRDALRDQGVTHEAILVEHMMHGFQTPFAPPMSPAPDEVEERFIRFLDTHVKGESALR
jgi:acetyl esterase/lipase